MSISMVLSTFTMLYKHENFLYLGLFHHPQTNSLLIKLASSINFLHLYNLDLSRNKIPQTKHFFFSLWRTFNTKLQEVARHNLDFSQDLSGWVTETMPWLCVWSSVPSSLVLFPGHQELSIFSLELLFPGTSCNG